MAEKSDGIVRWAGLNAVSDPSLVEAGELVAGRNLVARSGALRKRPGLLRLTDGETGLSFPPYVPPIDLPWVVQGDLWFTLEVPVGVVVGDEWTLTVNAVNRSGAAAETFEDYGNVGLTIEGLNASEEWVGFTSIELAAGGSIDVTTGWDGSVWSAAVKVTALDGCSQLRVTVTYKGDTRDQETVDLEELDSLEVVLPAGGVTPGLAFSVYLRALNADGDALLWFNGSGVTLAWDDGDSTSLAVLDEDGAALVADDGWESSWLSLTAVLGDRGTAESLRLQASYGGSVEGEDTAEIVETFIGIWPAHAQAFEERTLELWALDVNGDFREDFDGTGYSLLIEGYDADAEAWSTWEGLVTADGGIAPDVTAGWSEGKWSEVLRFTSCGDFSQVRITLLRGEVEALQETGYLHWIDSGEVSVPSQVAALTAFPVVIGILDEEGYTVDGFDGTSFALSAQNEDGDEIALTDEEGEALDFSAGWDGGVWQGDLMFADAADGDELVLIATYEGVEIGRTTAEIGAGAPGEAYEFTVWLPSSVSPRVQFELMLIAKDAFGSLVDDYDGTGLELSWKGIDDRYGAIGPVSVSLHDSLLEGWEDGVWRGQCTLVDANRCETLRVTTLLDGEARGSAEAPCALTFTMTAPGTVTAGNEFTLSMQVIQPDGALSSVFAGTDLELEMSVAEDDVFVAADHELNVNVGWEDGLWSSPMTIEDAGEVKLVLKHEGETEATLTITVEAQEQPPLIPDPPEEEEPVQLSLSVPSRVWPGVPFSFYVGADQIEYEGEGASLTVSPSVTPSPSVGSGWSGGEWGWYGYLGSGVTGGTLDFLLTWTPESVPEDAAVGDFQEEASVPIGELVGAVSLPSSVGVGDRFTVTVRMLGDGTTLLTAYDGTGYGGLSVQVSEDGSTWVDAAGALLNPSGGALSTSPWSSGQLRPSAVLQEAYQVYSYLRVAAIVNGVVGEYAVTEIEGVRLRVTLEGPEALHVYGVAGAVTLAVTDAGGSPLEIDHSRLSLEIEGFRSGSWQPFTGLQDEDTGLALSLDSGWTGTTWCVDALLVGLEGCDVARIKVLVDGDTIGDWIEVGLRDYWTAAITAPASVVEDNEFSLSIAITDGLGGVLPRWDDSLLVVDYGSVPSGVSFIDTDTSLPPDFSLGWSADWVWSDGNLRIGSECAFTITVKNTAGETLDTAEIEVLAIEGLVLDAIRERQLAAGRSVWAEGSEHTFSEYQTEVNALGPSFVDGTYSGGSAEPTMMSATCASGSTLLADLYVILCSMLSTKHSATIPGLYGWWYVTGYEGSAETAKGLVESNWSPGGVSASQTSSYKWVQTAGGATLFKARGNMVHWEFLVTGVPTGITHTYRFFSKHEQYGVYTPDTYTSFGHAGVPSAADTYEVVKTFSGETGSSKNTGELGAPSLALASGWPGTPSSDGYASIGYGQCTGKFVLVDWEFVHT